MNPQPFNHPMPLYLQDYATKHPEPPARRAFPIGEVLALFFFCATVGVVLSAMGVKS